MFRVTVRFLFLWWVRSFGMIRFASGYRVLGLQEPVRLCSKGMGSRVLMYLGFLFASLSLLQGFVRIQRLALRICLIKDASVCRSYPHLTLERQGVQ